MCASWVSIVVEIKSFESCSFPQELLIVMLNLKIVETSCVKDPCPSPSVIYSKVVDPVLATDKGTSLHLAANTNLLYGSESPVTAFPPNKKGFHDILGNAWEW